jgi:hypothetical protein
MLGFKVLVMYVNKLVVVKINLGILFTILILQIKVGTRVQKNGLQDCVF